MKMTRFVHANMRILDTSEALASAAEVAAAMAGDCTEHAVLLTAMCRAQGIPARVAIGLVYSAELKGFGYHMWTEAWVSEGWLSLDATRRDGRVGAGHLKMAVSNLQGVSPYEAFLPVMNAMGRLTLEVQESKRDRAVLVPLP
jgi:transglutaminase-like putative cysteine protease